MKKRSVGSDIALCGSSFTEIGGQGGRRFLEGKKVRHMSEEKRREAAIEGHKKFLNPQCPRFRADLKLRFLKKPEGSVFKASPTPHAPERKNE